MGLIFEKNYLDKGYKFIYHDSLDYRWSFNFAYLHCFGEDNSGVSLKLHYNSFIKNLFLFLFPQSVPDFDSYGGGMSSAKSALESDTRVLAYEAGRKGKIRVNTISAGTFSPF